MYLRRLSEVLGSQFRRAPGGCYVNIKVLGSELRGGSDRGLGF